MIVSNNHSKRFDILIHNKNNILMITYLIKERLNNFLLYSMQLHSYYFFVVVVFLLFFFFFFFLIKKLLVIKYLKTFSNTVISKHLSEQSERGSFQGDFLSICMINCHWHSLYIKQFIEENKMAYS